jgi:hypothetical protein
VGAHHSGGGLPRRRVLLARPPDRNNGLSPHCWRSGQIDVFKTGRLKDRSRSTVTAAVTMPTGAGWRWSALNPENQPKLVLTGAGWR